MLEGYQIIELKNRVSDVLTQMSIKVSDVLTLLGQRCADNYQLFVIGRRKYSTETVKIYSGGSHGSPKLERL